MLNIKRRSIENYKNTQHVIQIPTNNITDFLFCFLMNEKLVEPTRTGNYTSTIFLSVDRVTLSTIDISNILLSMR